MKARRAFEVPASHGRTARSTQVYLAFGTLSVLPPRFEKRCSKEPVRLWAIRLWEEHTPEGEEPKDGDAGDLGPHDDAGAGPGAREMV